MRNFISIRLFPRKESLENAFPGEISARRRALIIAASRHVCSALHKVLGKQVHIVRLFLCDDG